MSDVEPTKPTNPDSTLPYQPITHAPPQKRVAAVITGATGVVSACIGGGLGVVGVAAAFTGNFGIAAAISAFLSVVFLACAVILFRQANYLWGWVA